MELQSDFSKIQHLLKTDDITSVQFSEVDDYPQEGGFYANLGVASDDELIERSDREQASRGEAMERSKIEERKLREINLNDVDIGETKILDPLTGGEDLDQREKELRQIYDKAKQYRQRLMNVQNKMMGGNYDQSKSLTEKTEEDDELQVIDINSLEGRRKVDALLKEHESQMTGGKRELNPTIRVMLDITKILRESGKYDKKGFKQPDYMKIAKLILDDAKKIARTEDSKEARDKAIELAETKSNKYVEQYEKSK